MQKISTMRVSGKNIFEEQLTIGWIWEIAPARTAF